MFEGLSDKYCKSTQCWVATHLWPSMAIQQSVKPSHTSNLVRPGWADLLKSLLMSLVLLGLLRLFLDS